MSTLSDQEFLSKVQWKTSTSANLKDAATAGDVKQVAIILQKKFRQSASARQKKKNSTQALHRLLWSRHAFEEIPRTADLTDEINRKSTDWNLFLKAWMKKVTAEQPVTSYELLILLELLQHHSSRLSPKVFWKLWRVSLSAAILLSNNIEEPVGGWPTRDQILMVQGEIPWVAGKLFSDIKQSAQFRKCGRNLLRKELSNCTDTDGSPQAELMPCLLYWLAAYVRLSDDQTKGDRLAWWNDVAFDQFQNLVKMLTRLLRADGHIASSGIVSGTGSATKAVTLLKHAANITKFGRQSRTMQLLREVEQLLAGKKREKKKSRKSTLPNKTYPTVQSDWGELSSLRSDWSAQADLLTVMHHQETTQLELSVAGDLLLSGSWEMAVSVDGEPIPITNDWTCSCSSSDKDMDYLELQLKLTDEIFIERQILLSRTEQMAFLADVVSGAGDARVDYLSRLPIAKKVKAEPAIPTREWTLQRKGHFARLFPLALPQERIQSVAGRLGFSDVGEGKEKLTLQQAALGGVYAPLLLCWHPRRKRAYVDWRKLTVTHDGDKLSTAAASGHRIRLGSRQWLLYHNVNKAAQSRTVLGHHTLSETVFGFFNPDGEVNPILVVK